MDKERNNDTLDINAKYKDMMYVSKRIVEHHEFVTDGSCEPPIFVCLAYDVKNYLPKLLEDNEELKKQLEVGKEQYNDLVEEKEKLEVQLSNSHQIKNQQKEFIEWLEQKVKKYTPNLRVSELDEFGYRVAQYINAEVYEIPPEDVVKEVLSKYKEIIGVKGE